MARLLAVSALVTELEGRARGVALHLSSGARLDDPSGIATAAAWNFLRDQARGEGTDELVCFGVDDLVPALTGSLGVKNRALLDETGEVSWQGFGLEYAPGQRLVLHALRTRLTIVDGTALFGGSLRDAMRDWSVGVRAPTTLEGQCRALVKLLAAVDAAGWLHRGGLGRTIAWSEAMRAPAEPLQPAADPIPADALTAERPWMPCLNCAEPVWEPVWMYCGPGCSESAKAVRYARRHRLAGTLDRPDIAAAVREKIGQAASGGYDEGRHRLSPQQRAEVFARDDFRCRRCPQPATEIDHVGGPFDGDVNHPDNLEALCGDCHREKTNASRRPATATEAAKIEALLLRIEAAEPTRLADQPTFDRVWRAVRTRRTAIAAAVAVGSVGEARRAAETDGLADELARRWRSGPNITAATAKDLAKLRILDLAELRALSATGLMDGAQTVGITAPAALKRLLAVHERAARAPQCLL